MEEFHVGVHEFFELEEACGLLFTCLGGIACAFDVVVGASEEVEEADAWDGDGVLEGEEDACFGAFVGWLADEVDAVEEYLAAFNLIFGVAHEGVCEGAFAGAVGAHDGVDFALVDCEADAFDDLLAFNAYVKIFDLKS